MIGKGQPQATRTESNRRRGGECSDCKREGCHCVLSRSLAKGGESLFQFSENIRSSAAFIASSPSATPVCLCLNLQAASGGAESEPRQIWRDASRGGREEVDNLRREKASKTQRIARWPESGKYTPLCTLCEHVLDDDDARGCSSCAKKSGGWSVVLTPAVPARGFGVR